MTIKEHLDFLKRISQKVANWPAWRKSGIVPEEKPDQFIQKSGEHVAVGWKKPLAEDFVSSGKEKLSEEFKAILEKAKENLEIIRTTGRPHDQDMWCSHCHKMLPCRFRPSPEAGPFWSCSECGEVIGE